MVWLAADKNRSTKRKFDAQLISCARYVKYGTDFGRIGWDDVVLSALISDVGGTGGPALSRGSSLSQAIHHRSGDLWGPAGCINQPHSYNSSLARDNWPTLLHF
jgi:hypothetical protein